MKLAVLVCLNFERWMLFFSFGIELRNVVFGFVEL